MTDGAILISDLCLIVERRHARRFDLIAYCAVTLETCLPNGAPVQHLRIGRSVGRMTRRTSFGL